jgi:GT2 family glycosyltransferase
VGTTGGSDEAGVRRCGRRDIWPKLAVRTVSVSVVIVNWNSGALLERCLATLCRQTLMPDHVLVVDNGSTDHSSDCVERFPPCVLLRAGKNLGFAAGNNLAFRQCETEFVALLNPDAFPDEHWLENLISAAMMHPGCAAFGSRQLSASDPDIIDGIGDAYHFSGRVWRERHGSVQNTGDLVPRGIFSPCAAAALYRRRAVEEIGGFDEDYFCYAEDVDLGFRLRLMGYSARYVPDAVVLHCASAVTGGQHSDFSVYHGHRNLVWTFVKDMPGPLLWLLFPAHLALNVAAVAAYALDRRAGLILRAKWDALKGLPRMWAKRKAVQRNRVASVADIWAVLSKGVFPV